VVRHIFQACLCGYTLRVTSQASYSPEYTTPTQKKMNSYFVKKREISCLLTTKMIGIIRKLIKIYI
jgi:hypothetical protein